MRASSTVWPEVALGALCEINIGRTPARERREFWGPSFPWLSIADMNQGREIRQTKEMITERAVRECNCRQVEAGTVLLSFKLSIGKVGIASVPLFTNEAIAALPIRDERRLDPVFLTWALQSINLASGLDRAAKGLTLNKAKLIDVPIPLPPLAEQRRIATILDQAEALRAKRRHALAQLDTLIQYIFLDLFGDPAANPKGWPIVRIGDLLSSASYGSSEKAGATGEFPILRMNNITTTGKLDLEDLKYIDIKPSEHDRYLVHDGDILFNRTNSAELVGKTAIFRGAKPMAYAGYLIRLRTNEKADPEFVSGVLNSRYGKRTLRGMCKSIIGMANINAKEVQAIPIPQPPLSLQREFATQVSAVERLKASQRASLAKLDALFASLQHRAFRGEL
jgi:type I restriction enzyme S subunit